MKILIVYATKTGSTRESAEMLKSAIAPHEVTLCDASREDVSPSGYDKVVVGSYIRFGKCAKSIAAYLKKYGSELTEGKAAYFICCAYADMADTYIEETFGRELLRNAVYTANFGGTLKVERQKNFIMKLLVRAMRNEIVENGESDDEAFSRTLPELMPSEINKFADVILGK